ncbi:L-histidine N(alpha)-methyltransferase [Sphingorhabdus sp. IMCC26285]|uniref:L-histidine N(Alpha)-methyltransferase n=1 Tax=Sphingorhabdus profundilacus TaxID=2509718 RepID=A0A6I4M0B2_9SPHN|nr:L-histidine N(alpha)-methyltransferase [Sphingorhabdus profundilacus]MVZ97746.1 L-histidine N(alpha)-methyltransferase [Sphingorhabdus profundilacus]
MSETALLSRADPQFLADVLEGLRGPRRAIPARWFYDERGSTLFDEITRLPEYYPTRNETALLKNCKDALAEQIASGGAVIEFGAGSATKTPLLLEAIDPEFYVPVDISGDYLRNSATVLQSRFPDLNIIPVEADFTQTMVLPDNIAYTNILGFFPGSTIGNFVPRSGVDLLRHMRATLGEGAKLLIGFDRIKSADVLVPAYDDAAGVTAAFNLNLLHRINRELGGDIPVDAFLHQIVWNDLEARVEMHLRCNRDIRFSVAGVDFSFDEGDSIHTENSHKYDLRSLRLLLRSGCWTPVAEYSDPEDWFTLVLAEAAPIQTAP